MLIAAGRITGLLAGYLMALVVLQMARVPALERRVGSDRVARWHAMSGRYTICLVVAHVVLIIWGYAAPGRRTGARPADRRPRCTTSPTWSRRRSAPGCWCSSGFVSIGAVRRRIPYDTWYHMHLLTYAAVFLTFWHQLATGNEFVANPTAKTAWYALYGAVDRAGRSGTGSSRRSG